MVRSVSARDVDPDPPAPGVANLSCHLNVVPHGQGGEQLLVADRCGRPRRARRAGPAFVTSWPSIDTRPDLGAKRDR